MQSFNSKRRSFLGVLLGLAFLPINALAAAWNKAAFETNQLETAEKGLGVHAETPSKEIEITAPDRAENGAIVQLEVKSNIPNTEAIAVFVEKNPTVLIGNFMFSNGALPQIITRIKMAETSDIKIVVKAGDQYFTASKNVVVLENGCG